MFRIHFAQFEGWRAAELTDTASTTISSQKSRIQEMRRPRPGPPYAKNRSATRSPPASSGQRPQNLTQEAGSNPSVPDASEGKNPFII